MNFSGEREFNVDAQQLWNYLMDPEVLAKITPGVTRLQTIGADQYKSISDIKIGPVKGKFTGKLSIEDKQEPEAFAIQMEQLSKIGNAQAKVIMNLNEVQPGTTQLLFDAKAQLSGVIARTGQRVLSGVANTITKEVFASLQQHIDEQKALNVTTKNTTPEQTAVIQNASKEDVTKTVETQSSNEIEQSTHQSISLLQRIINFIKKLFGIK